MIAASDRSPMTGLMSSTCLTQMPTGSVIAATSTLRARRALCSTTGTARNTATVRSANGPLIPHDDDNPVALNQEWCRSSIPSTASSRTSERVVTTSTAQNAR